MRILGHVAFAGVSLMALSAPAFAQEAPADETAGNEDIVVQARRRDETVQDVPLSIQAVTGQQLQKLEIRQFEDVSKVVPGLVLQKSGTLTSASLRGINFDNRASGSSTSVEFYRNDAVITSQALFQAVYDIGQVEVLRGPQGTLRGRASPSGSITVTTRRPDLTEPGGYVNGSVSNEHRWNFNGAVNVPIIADKLGIRVAGFMGESRGNNIFGLNVPLNTIDRDVFDNTGALRASVRADPFDGVLVLDFNYETIKNSNRQYAQVQSLSQFNGGTASPRTVLAEDRLGVGAFAGTNDPHIEIYNWQAVLRQWGQRLTYVGGRTTIRGNTVAPLDASGLFSSPTSVTPPAAAPIDTFAQYTNTQSKQVSHELRLQNEDRIAGLFDYTLGAFRVDGESPTLLFAASPSSVTTIPGNPTLYTLNSMSYRGTLRFRKDREESLFANVTLHLGEKTEITGGLRHIWYKADSGTISNVSFADPFNSGTLIQRRCYGNPGVAGCLPIKEATIYAASLKHNFNEDLMAYFSFGTSWRPGNSLVGWGLQNAGTPLTVGSYIDRFLNLPDEKSKSFEVGFKSAWLDRRLRFNVSAFYQKFDNYPLYGSTSVQSLNQPTQAGAVLLRAFNFAAPVQATIKGVEADLSFDVTPRFNLVATFAFADSRAKGAVVPCVDTDNDNIQDSAVLSPTGTQAQVDRYNLWLQQIGTNQVDTCALDASPSSSARFSGTVQAEYRHPIGDRAEGYLRGFTSWKGESAGDAVNPNDQVGAYALVDLFAGVRDPDGAWEVSGFVKNLFNTRRVISRGANVLNTSISAAGASATYNYLNITTTQPREVGVSLRYAFGSR